MTNSAVTTVTNPAVRHDFIIIMEGRICNPNGDPNAGNSPRQLPTNQVYATSTSMSNRISQTAELLYGASNLYRSGNNLDTIQQKYILEKKGPDELMSDFWDRRGNGGLFASFGKNVKEVVETGYRGIYRLYPSVSLNVPALIEQAITSATTNSKGNRTMGSSSYADWVLTKGTGTFNACINAKRNNTIDSEYMGQWLVCLWHHALQTASLQRGEWDLVDCIIASHRTPYGNAQLSAISELVNISVDEQKHTYNVQIGEAPDGVIIHRLSEIIDELLSLYPPTVSAAA
jgi:CRISPR/Cas system type I-B associated protein Csh2 (Cas7 group RAMP superfamily)